MKRDPSGRVLPLSLFPKTATFLFLAGVKRREAFVVSVPKDTPRDEAV